MWFTRRRSPGPVVAYGEVHVTTPLRAQFVAALTALAVLIAGSGFVRAQYFCRMMNRVVSSTCCCSKAAAHHDEPSYGPEARDTDCCQKIAANERSSVASASKTDGVVPPLAASEAPAPVIKVHAPRLAVVELPVRARAPPALGPPLFIAHCRLLT